MRKTGEHLGHNLLSDVIDKRIAEKQEEYKKAAKDLASKYHSVFSSPAGQEVLEHIVEVSGLFSTGLRDDNPHLMAINEGSRRLAMNIVNQVSLGRSIA